MPAGAWDGARYDRVADPQARWGGAVLDRLQLVGDETVLDCGCGSGRVTAQVLARVPSGHVVALDASDSMLAEARRRLVHDADRVTFVKADLLELTPATLGRRAPVDAVFSSATFHHVTDHPRLFANLAAVLRPGGRLSAQCGAEGNVAGLLALVAQHGITSIGHREYASAEVTRQRLQAAGFTEVRTWTHTEPTRFDDGETLMDFLEAVCLREPLAALPADQRRELTRAVVASMDEPVIDYVRLNIVARRGPLRTPRPLSL